MEFLEMLGNASIVARLSLLVSIFPLGAGLAYVLRPSEPRLALMRPVSLAGLFAALCGTVTGAINVLRLIWTSEGPVHWRIVAVGSAESLVPLLRSTPRATRRAPQLLLPCCVIRGVDSFSDSAE